MATTASASDPPQITVEDLNNFQARHFQQLLDRVSRPIFPNSIEHQSPHGVYETEYEAEDDYGDLGVYPDGTSRTLTDEQIAIFRHTEIQEILSARRRAALLRESSIESDGEDGELVDEDDDNAAAPVENSLVETHQANLDTGIDDIDDQDEEAYAQYLEKERQELLQQQREEETAKRQASNRHMQFHENDRLVSTRRRVREMDEMKVDDAVMDYGDESSTVHPNPPDVSTPTTNTTLAKSDMMTGTVESTLERQQGRKIWWPEIKPA